MHPTSSILRQFYSLLLIAILLTSCHNRDNTTSLNSNVELEQVFQQLAEQVLSDSSNATFRLDSLTDFAWDSVLVLTPYTPIDFLEKSANLDLTDLYHTRITVNEGSNVLAFIKNQKLVNFVELSALNGTFDYYDSTRYYQPSTAIFAMELTDGKFVGGQNIIKVKPIIESNGFVIWF